MGWGWSVGFPIRIFPVILIEEGEAMDRDIKNHLLNQGEKAWLNGSKYALYEKTSSSDLGTCS